MVSQVFLPTDTLYICLPPRCPSCLGGVAVTQPRAPAAGRGKRAGRRRREPGPGRCVRSGAREEARGRRGERGEGEGERLTALPEGSSVGWSSLNQPFCPPTSYLAHCVHLPSAPGCCVGPFPRNAVHAIVAGVLMFNVPEVPSSLG